MYVKTEPTDAEAEGADPKQKHGRDAPTMMRQQQLPAGLITQFIQDYVKFTEWDDKYWIVDPYAGTLSAGVAAHTMKCHFWGCEMDTALAPYWDDVRALLRDDETYAAGSALWTCEEEYYQVPSLTQQPHHPPRAHDRHAYRRTQEFAPCTHAPPRPHNRYAAGVARRHHT